jgi:hypothetical protein
MWFGSVQSSTQDKDHVKWGYVLCPQRFKIYEEMAHLKEQHTCIKFCFKLGLISAETYKLLKLAFREETVNRIQTFDWFSEFKIWLSSVNDAEYSE